MSIICLRLHDFMSAMSIQTTEQKPILSMFRFGIACFVIIVGDNVYLWILYRTDVYTECCY